MVMLSYLLHAWMKLHEVTSRSSFGNRAITHRQKSRMLLSTLSADSSGRTARKQRQPMIDRLDSQEGIG